MDYQQEYYKKKYREEKIREYVYRAVRTVNSQKYRENGESETAEQRKDRLDWYYDTMEDVEKCSLQNLYRRYINNLNFYPDGREWRDRLGSELNKLDRGRLELFLGGLSALRFKDDEDLIGDAGRSDLTRAINEIEERLFNLNAESRTSYATSLFRKNSCLFFIVRYEESMTRMERQFVNIRVQFLRRLDSTLNLFNIDLVDILKNLGLYTVIFNHPKLESKFAEHRHSMVSIDNKGQAFLIAKDVELEDVELEDESEDDIPDSVLIRRKPKVTAENASILTQDQLSLLFDQLRKEKVLNANASNSLISSCVAAINGSSEDAMRQKMSDLGLIYEDKKNRESVVVVLKSIIDKIERNL